MSVKYKWWSYVKWMVRLYPERVRALREKQQAAVTASYAGMPRGGGPGRATERLATVTLGKPVDREMEAVRRAIEHTKTLPDGQTRLRLIDLAYWKQSHSLVGACAACGTSERTGQRWNAEFIYEVAKNFDLI